MELSEIRNYLSSKGWIQSWSDDNWVREESTNHEANCGIDTKSAYAYQQKIDDGKIEIIDGKHYEVIKPSWIKTD